MAKGNVPSPSNAASRVVFILKNPHDALPTKAALKKTGAHSLRDHVRVPTSPSNERASVKNSFSYTYFVAFCWKGARTA
jgi:hypothetical protein